jgi:gas vesicle protein
MNSKPLVMGMLAGTAVGCGVAMMMQPSKKKSSKKMVGKTLRAIGDMADSISDTMGL